MNTRYKFGSFEGLPCSGDPDTTSGVNFTQVSYITRKTMGMRLASYFPALDLSRVLGRLLRLAEAGKIQHKLNEL